MALKTKNKMEAKEFKEKFKIGNVITSELKGTPLTITAIGENGFMAKDNEGREYVTCFTFNRDWQHYKEPVEKDLEDVERFFVVYKSEKKIKVDIIFGNNDHFMHMKNLVGDMDCHEILTEQEAIERGLKI